MKILEKIAWEIPEIGVLTTKSIGPRPREGYREPIYTQYAPGCFINAVGLTNPGAEEMVKQLQAITLPQDRFLLTSIFGATVEEYIAVAKILAPYSDGLELNLSCPNAQGYGMAMGQDANMVYEITKAVKAAVDIPVIPKLTPNVPDIASIAKAAVEAGADAICGINSVGPGYYTVDGHPVLSNVYGGMCGNGILPIGLKCAREITQAVDVPLISCGGIMNADNVKAYQQTGTTVFGIGTALTGLSLEELKTYFSTLREDLGNNTNTAQTLLKTSDLRFTKYHIVENKRLADDLSLLVFDRSIKIESGQFVFTWLPGIGEKPFSVLDDQPLTLAIQRRGCFTETLCDLEAGAIIYIRGPYGTPIKLPRQKAPILVSGGCGLAALYHIAKTHEGSDLFIGAKDSEHLFYLENVRNVANVHIATEDGSSGSKGFITELLEQYLQHRLPGEEPIFFNCGPEAMIESAVNIEQHHTSPKISIIRSIT